MASSIVSLAMALALSSTGGLFQHRGYVPGWQGGGRILPPGPGLGWGFPNDNPDGYGYVDYGTYQPQGADRTPDYNFPRYFAVPPYQIFLPSYYNPYLMRGQRYIPYTGCGGAHPAGGAPTGSSLTPMYPYNRSQANRPVVTPPRYSGRTEGPPENAGGSGLVP